MPLSSTVAWDNDSGIASRICGRVSWSFLWLEAKENQIAKKRIDLILFELSWYIRCRAMLMKFFLLQCSAMNEGDTTHLH
jgi:hypothetical protein